MKYSAARYVAPLVCFVLVVLAFVVATPAASATESTVEGPVERTLPSGAQAVLWPRPGSGTVLVTVAVPAGSQDEPAGMGGLSHYLEHLLFDGFDDLDERGVTESFENLSAYMNAFTREQTTVYFALVPRDDAVATAELMAGMLTRSKIEPVPYDKEKKVILEELAKDHASANGLKEEKLRATLWGGTPLAHPVGGTVQSVEATTREEVVRYWQNRYDPSGYRLLITGDLPVEGLEMVLAPFAKLRTSASPSSRREMLDWPGWGHWSAAEAPEAPDGAGGMPPMGMGSGHGMPGKMGGPAGGTMAVVIAAPDALATSGTELEIVARWLADADGHLSAALRPEWAREISVTRVPREPRDLLEIRIEAAAGVDPQDLLGRLRGALDAAAAGPEDSHVMSIQRAWVGERALSDQRLHYAAVFYGDALAASRGGLADSVAPPEVSPPEVRAAAAELLGDAVERTRAAWLGKGGPDGLSDLPEVVAPAAQSADAVLKPGPMGSLVTTLENGLTVGILPETGSAVFGIHLLVADRTLNEPEDSPGVTDLIHRLLPGGTVLGDSRDVASRLQRSGVDLKAADSAMIPFDNRYHVPDFSYVRLEGPATSFEPAVVVLAEMLRVPVWDDEGWRSAADAHREEKKADNRGSEKARQLFFGSLLGPQNPLAKAVSGPADADVAEAAVVREIWGSWPDGYFAPDRLVLTIASPLTAIQTLEIIEDSFSGGLKATPRRGPYPEPQPLTEAIEVEVGEAPQVTLLWGLIANVAAEDRVAMLVAMDAMSDRMTAVIREREGLAYRLGAGVRHLPGGGWILSASVGTRPDNTERVAALLKEIVAGLGTESLSAADLGRLHARQRRTRMLRTLSAASRAYRLGRALFEGPGSPLLVDDAAYAAVTPEQVQAVVKRYLDPQKMLLVVTP
jgi:zinc protease